ncbi:MAG: hypothetical protein K940chlam9_01088 [Chlamydiae bacterium]|nr:hypothetical protein [Chlamydiota bacterium]
MKSTKHTYSGLRLLRHLVGQEGLNIFSSQQVQQAARELKIEPGYVAEILHYLQKESWIWRLKRGLYAVSSESGLGTAVRPAHVGASPI